MSACISQETEGVLIVHSLISVANINSQMPFSPFLQLA